MSNKANDSEFCSSMLLKKGKISMITKEWLADEIEQFMFERGEYDYRDYDRIPWVNTDDRNAVQKNIENSLGTVKSVYSLIDYLESEIAVMDKDDELVKVYNDSLKDALLEVSLNFAFDIDFNEDVQISDDYDSLDVCVFANDQTLDTLMKRADMYSKSGYEDFDEILESSAYVNTYIIADNDNVKLALILDDEVDYCDVTFAEHPEENEFMLTQIESKVLREKLEQFLGKTPAEYLKEIRQEVKDKGEER